MRVGNMLVTANYRIANPPSNTRAAYAPALDGAPARNAEQRSANLALNVETIAFGYVCGFLAGAGLMLMILR